MFRFIPLILFFFAISSRADDDVTLVFIPKVYSPNLSASAVLAKPEIETAQTQIFVVQISGFMPLPQMWTFKELDKAVEEKSEIESSTLSIVHLRGGNFAQRLSATTSLLAFMETPEGKASLSGANWGELQVSAESLLVELLELRKLRAQHESVDPEMEEKWLERIADAEKLNYLIGKSIEKTPAELVSRMSSFFKYEIILEKWLTNDDRASTLLEAQINEFDRQDLAEKPAKLWRESFLLMASPDESIRGLADRYFRDFIHRKTVEATSPEALSPELSWFYRMLSEVTVLPNLPELVDKKHLDRLSLKLLAELLVLSQPESEAHRQLWDSTYALLNRLKIERGITESMQQDLQLIEFLLTQKKAALDTKQVERFAVHFPSLRGGDSSCAGAMSSGPH